MTIEDFGFDYVRYDPIEWGPVGEITYKRTYEHNKCGFGKTVRDVVNLCFSLQLTHCYENGITWNKDKAIKSAKTMYDLIYEMKFLPPGRGLDCGRVELVNKLGGAILNNCAFVSTGCNTLEPFHWTTIMLCLGAGVGFDTKGKYKIVKKDSFAVNYVIPDSREGFANAIVAKLSEYLATGVRYNFDYSQIRKKGAIISSTGEKAGGYECLKQCIDGIDDLLKGKSGFISEADIADIFMLIGRLVSSANKRRSALLGLGTSEEYCKMKTPENKDHPFRWSANLSLTNPDKASFKYIESGNELGVFWLDNAQKYGRMSLPPDYKDIRAQGTNPCSEQTLESYELCNLVETFPSRHENKSHFLHTLKYAYLYSKSITLAKTGFAKTDEIVNRNRRIGCSISGISDSIAKFGYNNFIHGFLPEGYKCIDYLDTVYSNWLKIPESIKKTSVKPSGTVSKLPGVNSGMSYPIGEYYFQVIRFKSDSPYITSLRNAGYKVVDLSPKEPNTHCVYFPIKVKHFTRGQDDLSMREQVELVAQLQSVWSDNQVSASIIFTEDERSDIPNVIEQYRTRVKSLTFFPKDTKRFEHQPWQKISKEEYENYVKNVKQTYFVSEREESDKFCNSISCER